jgi:hypothetical protein
MAAWSGPPRLKVPPLRLFHSPVTLCLCAVVGGCAAGRTNARLQPGWGGAVGFSAAILDSARADVGLGPGPRKLVPAANLQVEVQYAWTSPEGTGTAIAARAPIGFLLASLDVYRQFSGSERWSFGAGVELGLFGAGYAILTHHFGPTYLSLTARALTPIATWRSSSALARDETILAPQLAFGHLGRHDASVFLMYGRPLGPGLDLGFGSNIVYRQWLFLGVSVRF